MRVFLSHSTKDKDFVQQLSAAILGSGSETWLCELDVAMQANFVAEIERGLKWCEVALLIWSPDAAASHWTEAEWTSVLARQVAEQKTRLGIVLLRDQALPELLRTTNYIDARTDPREAFRRVVAWLEHRDAVKRFLGLPEYRPQDFVGRALYLEKLRTTFSGDPMVFLHNGEPGTGKSTLALQFAWNAQKDFDAVVYQTCGQRTLDAITAELVERLPIDVKTLPPDKQRDVAKEYLRQRDSLLILDDVWPSGDGKIEIREFEPGPACSVLYTSRQKSLPGLVPKQTSKVEKFTDVEAQELFHTYLDDVFSKKEVDDNKKPLLDFATRVEMLPIAVSVGASLLRDKSAMTLSKAISKLQVSALADGEKNVNNLFAQAIESQPEREQRLLAACAVCVQEGFWLPLAAQIAELSEDDADEAANTLVKGSLLRVLDRDRRRFQLHALLREQLRTRAGTDGLAQLQERHAAELEVLFKEWQTRWQDCRECLGEIDAAAQFLWERGERLRENWLTDWGYLLSKRIGEMDASMRILNLDEVLRRGQSDRESQSELQAIYGNQALILQLWGRLDEAMSLHKKEETICLELGDKDSLQRSYGNQALILQVWGRLEEALALHKKQEAMCLELGNKDSLQRSYGNQGLILQAWGRLEEALALHKKKEAVCLELGNKDSLQRSYGNQALILKDWGRLEEALALHKKQEAICLELGNKDSLQISYGNQAAILRDQGKLSDALALYRKAEAICLELGNKSSLARWYWHIGYLAGLQGDHATEKQKLQQALALFTELGMPRERDDVQAALDQLNSTEPPANS